MNHLEDNLEDNSFDEDDLHRIVSLIDKYQRIVIRVFNNINVCKDNKILSQSDYESINEELNKIVDNCNIVIDTIYFITDITVLYGKMQQINDSLSLIMKNHGAYNCDDLLFVCFGGSYTNTFTIEQQEFYSDIILKHFTPIGYKTISWEFIKDKTLKSRKPSSIFEDVTIAETTETLDVYELGKCNKDNFFLKLQGAKICFKNELTKETLIIRGYFDNTPINYIQNRRVLSARGEILENINMNDDIYNTHYKTFEMYVKSLMLKDLLVNKSSEHYDIFTGYIHNVRSMKKKSISKLCREFMSVEFFEQREIIYQLLLFSDDFELQFIAYLLYDLLSFNKNETNEESVEQDILYNSLPYVIKSQFKGAMKETIKYTTRLTNPDIQNNLPIEQRICLLKTDDKVKEKAMTKLKELKSKSEDSGSKARQYLDGLLKIPFGIHCEEPIMEISKKNVELFKTFVNGKEYNKEVLAIENKSEYNHSEVLQMSKKYIKNNAEYNSQLGGKGSSKAFDINQCYEKINVLTETEIKELFLQIETEFNEVETTIRIPYYSDSFNTSDMRDCLSICLNDNKEHSTFTKMLQKHLIKSENGDKCISNLQQISDNTKLIYNYFGDVRKALDSSVYGHKNAKKQVERIIGQWINGEPNGYCFGFEGPPGTGKCMAKDTPIMLSNGKIKMVQDITTKDMLMGDDGFERNVLALGSGREKMYRIEQVKGDDYTVNESHILSLKMTKAGRKGDKHQTILGKRYYKNDIVDICIKDYLELPKYLKECLKGYKVGLDFREQEVSLDPYAIGYWLGDGDKTTFSITTIDNEVIDYFIEYASENGLQLTKNDISYHITTGIKGGRCYKRNSFLNSLKQYNLINNKHIPDEYKMTSRENRLGLLAGLMDSDGHYDKISNCFDIIQKNKKLADDIVFLVRSLGMRATIKECEKSCMYKGERKCGIYHRITISGCGLEEIPVLLKRKKARVNKQIKGCLHTGIKVVPLEEDAYYGFQIDGNSRFLLGDFTVTHNTSLAKHGISKCLKDGDGNSRPFAFIAIGGSSNGSTLDGHNYTYVGSMWGKIVDILMETKCMNPIIFIDEVDKVSRTETGREIIGILTHLVDPTQNSAYQDKYFTGIDLDLSKVLFIFSYNDVDLVDRILLDRIHRIKFQHLSLEEKLQISEDYMLPEILKKMGQLGNINISKEVVQFIIETYTCEAGVRKLKEILFEIIGEINLELLHNNDERDLPVNISIDDVKQSYLKDRQKSRGKKVHGENRIGIINGLWANALGMGGIIPIEMKYVLSGHPLDLKLTGMQGDVMKESMNVAKTLAWSMTSNERQERLLKMFDATKTQGIHIHCPEGAVPKDGPSAGTAITVTMYSLLNDIKIKNTIAITGEIDLHGNVTAIGGLDLKIIGGIEAGVKEFLFPEANIDDFNKFKDKYGDKDLVNGIEFHPIGHIKEALEFALEK